MLHLKRVHSAIKTARSKALPDLSDQELLRYSRHILLPQLDVDGQSKLLHSCALIVGLGGLGSAVTLYLAGSGVGHLMLADGDEVEMSNLQRQILHAQHDIGKAKTVSASEKVMALNPNIKVDTLGRLEAEALDQAIQAADIVVDASDNFATRYAINSSCVAHRKNLVSGAAIRFEGQVAVFMLADEGHSCYECLYAPNTSTNDEPCSENGVLAPLVGMIGCMQAIAAVQILAALPCAFAGQLFLCDMLNADIRRIALSKRKDCSACSHRRRAS